MSCSGWSALAAKNEQRGLSAIAYSLLAPPSVLVVAAVAGEAGPSWAAGLSEGGAVVV